jgi:putative two-component system response regulator
MSTAGTVLVCDDQQENVDLVAAALAPLGYEVLPALDGETALAAARSHQPDVVLLDVMMPEMDGYEVCRRLKADPETRLLPVVFLTGLDSREARMRGLDAGATDFLSKPFDLTELEVRVRNLASFHRLTQELDHAEQMLFAIARAVEARDEVTGDHCERLSALAARLGERLGLGVDAVKALRRAGYLHDIGKIGVPDAVLLKPGPLTAEEWAVMRGHVEIGVSICAPLRTLRPVLPIIRHHHERRDGSGYPDRLRGDEIPLLARVFQVVDVFDALTNDRPYRRAVSPQEAVALIRDEVARGWWDPEIAGAFAAMVLAPAGNDVAAGELGTERHLL